MLDNSQYLPQRYHMIALLGTGGMGTVYHVYDRLSERDVALKRVTLAIEKSANADRLVLANEFRTLASLRHPNIISVLDYGFDREQRPFFTMELLENAQTILEAQQGRSIVQRVELLIQALEALAYLHRRGVLHHDIKPENILVAHDCAYLLDFGLAVLANHPRDNDAFGSLRYLAPEVLRGQPYTEASDLYSLGVVAYELLVGNHPFPAENIRDFLHLVRTASPNLDPIAEHSTLTAIIGQLLAKHPSQRLASAQAAMSALRQAIGQVGIDSGRTIRESYLQAASFVGRGAELAQLTDALDVAAQRQGSAWLIGGESGVGKTRLLDELRTHALVQGFQVLRGQAKEGGWPYQLWYSVLSQLVLDTELSDLEAGVLKELLPRLDQLLGRQIPLAPVLAGIAGEYRLALTIIGLLRRQTQPILLILEDIQWSEESLLLLAQISRIVDTLPLLVLASYRNDESPHLSNALPDMRLMLLERLGQADIAALSRAMLGDDMVHDGLVTFFQRETEGNVFFLVELVRAHAEEQNQRGQEGVLSLPTTALTGGIRHIVQRRLDKVPAWGQTLLRYAAVVGRLIELPLLVTLTESDSTLLPYRDLANWLTICKDVAVLDVAEHHWQFAHDKLRAGVLDMVSASELCTLHLQVGEAIERTYTQHLAQHYDALAYHFAQAGAVERELHYATLAGMQAVEQFAHVEALVYLSRALALTPKHDARARFALLLAREQVYDVQGERTAQMRDLAVLVELAEQLDDTRSRAEVAKRQARYAESIGDLITAAEIAQQAIDLAQQAGLVSIEAAGYLAKGIALRSSANYQTARECLEQGLVRARSLATPAIEMTCLSYLGSVETMLALHAQSDEHLLQALTLSYLIGDRRATLLTLKFLGTNAFFQGNLADSMHYYAEGLVIALEIGDRREQIRVMSNQGDNATYIGNFEQARVLLNKALHLSREIRDRLSEQFCLLFLSRLALFKGDYLAAVESSESTLMYLEETQTRVLQPQMNLLCAHALLELEHFERAKTYFQQAMELYSSMHLSHRMAEPLAGLAAIALREGQLDVALAQVKVILEQHSASVPENVDGLFFVYLTCYQVLTAVADPRASVVLHAACDKLYECADQLGSVDYHDSFLAGNAVRRTLLAAKGNPPTSASSKHSSETSLD